MCPQAPMSQIPIGLLTDAELITLLEEISYGYPASTPPTNVIADVNPLNCSPSHSPDGIMYFIRPDLVKKDVNFGSWKGKGNPREIFTNSTIIGWRTTLEFHEGQAPNDIKTDWVMQEYRLARKGWGNNTNTEDCGYLYRLIRNEEHISDHVVHPKHGGALPTDSSASQGSISEAQKKNGDDEIGSLTAAERLSCVLQGDFLELDDLNGVQSPSSSSDNSSCQSFASDEWFDSLALLRDLDDQNIERQRKDASFKYTVSNSVVSNEVVICPATVGKLCAEDIRKVDHSLPIKGRSDEMVLKCKQANETVGSSQMTAASSSLNKDVKGKKKINRMKKLKKYCCLMQL